MNSPVTAKKGARPFYLVGPTAVGKSAVAHYIAEEKGWPVLSADSMLVYRGMDIGTAKPSRRQRDVVDYMGIDLVEPDSPFSVWDYIEYVRSGLSGITDCVVAGGTGLYVQSLLCGLSERPGIDDGLRTHWMHVVEREGIAPLQNHLQDHYPEAYAEIEDKKNARRLVRALEIAEGGGKAEAWKEVEFCIPGLMMSPDDLRGRIESRVEKMFDDGLEDEVRGIMERYSELSDMASQAIGYSETIALINGECSADEARERIVKRTKRLAKRQMTWFRNQLNIDWIEISSGMEVSEVAGLVLKHWEKNGPAAIVTE